MVPSEGPLSSRESILSRGRRQRSQDESPMCVLLGICPVPMRGMYTGMRSSGDETFAYVRRPWRGHDGSRAS